MSPRTQTELRNDQPAPEGDAPDYLERTRAFWQPYAARQLTREDAREMAHNLIGFFTVLREWTIRERERQRLGIVPILPPAPRKRGRPRKHASAEDKMRP